jgi:predicted GIY-YIG superfamily endonuclease
VLVFILDLPFLCVAFQFHPGEGTHPDGKRDVLRLHARQQALWNPHIGTTSDLAWRVWEHKNNVAPGFTKRYGVDQLVWFEAYQSRDAAVQHEKQIEEWKRD